MFNNDLTLRTLSSWLERRKIPLFSWNRDDGWQNKRELSADHYIAALIAWLSLNWILERSWVALYSVVCVSVRHRCHPTKCPLFPIYTGIQALCWPNTIYKGIKALFWVTHSILGLVSYAFSNYDDKQCWKELLGYWDDEGLFWCSVNISSPCMSTFRNLSPCEVPLN